MLVKESDILLEQGTEERKSEPNTEPLPSNGQSCDVDKGGQSLQRRR